MKQPDGPVASTSATALRVSDLRVAVGEAAIVEDVAFTVGTGEILGVVGESGSGKTTTALALLGYTTQNAVITGGELEVAGKRVDLTDERACRGHRGRVVSYVPQNPGTALNPSMTIGAAIAEMLNAHGTGVDLDSQIRKQLRSVHLPDDGGFRRRYPHQLSGGQQQRVCIGVSLACGPPLVVLDEPTTGLDVVTQARILEELNRLRAEKDIAIVYVSHDLAVVGQLADRIAVMYAGRIVEDGPALSVLRRPRHAYTSGLVRSIPDHLDRRRLEPMPGVAVGIEDRPAGCAFAPRCTMVIDACKRAVPPLAETEPAHRTRCVRASDVEQPSRAPSEAPARPADQMTPVLSASNLRVEYRSARETVVAVDDVSLVLARGGCVALVGESGSGKTTIARAIAGLQPPSSGKIVLDDEDLAYLVRKRSADQRRRVQIIFQNPAEALNPRMSVAAAIGRPLRSLRGLSGLAVPAEVERLLQLVRLPPRFVDRYPAELSGGERQRVAIARALAASPDVVICDEITSALDVSVQAAVLGLLSELRQELGLSILFITHDLGVVSTIAGEVVVLELGKVRESGPVRELLEHPRHSYTRKLLESAPSITHALGQEGMA